MPAISLSALSPERQGQFFSLPETEPEFARRNWDSRRFSIGSCNLPKELWPSGPLVGRPFRPQIRFTCTPRHNRGSSAADLARRQVRPHLIGARRYLHI